MRHLCKMLLISAVTIGLGYTMTYANVQKLMYDGKVHSYNLPPITMSINNQPLSTGLMPSVQIGDRVLVPVKEVSEALGLQVDWKESEKSVYIYNDQMLVVLKVDSREVWINGEINTLDVPAKIINDKTMVPVRFISEALDYEVLWNNEIRHIDIHKKTQTVLEVVPDDLIDFPVFIEDTPIAKDDIADYAKETLEGEKTELEMKKDGNLEFENTLQGILYRPETREIILESSGHLDKDFIHVVNQYRQRKMIIDLGYNYLNLFDGHLYNEVIGPIKNLEVKTDETTKLVISTNTIHEVNIYEENQKIHIQFVKPREKYDKIIVIDPGHGGSAPGTSGGNIKEKDMTLKYGMDFYNLLRSDPNIKVYATREEDVDVGLVERTQIANEIDPDLFISIHNNSVDGTQEFKERVKGTETYYYDDPNDLRNKKFASLVQKGIVENFNMVDRRIKPDKGYVVLKNTNMPGVLIEVGFLSNTEDRTKMTQPDFSPRLASILYNCVIEYLN